MHVNYCFSADIGLPIRILLSAEPVVYLLGVNLVDALQ